MGRNYRFLLYGARPELAGLLAELAQLADPPQAKVVDLTLDSQTQALSVDAAADKNPSSLSLETQASTQLLTWLRFALASPSDPAAQIIREHWADDNAEHLPKGQFRFSAGIEITLSESHYELAISSPTSSGSMIFSFSPSVREPIRAWLDRHGVHFALFDSEQAAYKLLPRAKGATDTDWGSLELSFEEEDLILYSDRAGKLDACIAMLKAKILALPDSDHYLSSV